MVLHCELIKLHTCEFDWHSNPCCCLLWRRVCQPQESSSWNDLVQVVEIKEVFARVNEDGKWNELDIILKTQSEVTILNSGSDIDGHVSGKMSARASGLATDSYYCHDTFLIVVGGARESVARESVIYPYWLQLYMQVLLPLKAFSSERGKKLELLTSNGEGCLILKGDCTVNNDVVFKGSTTTKTYVAGGIYTTAYQVMRADDKGLVYLGEINKRGYDPYCSQEGDQLLWILVLKLRMVTMIKLVAVQVLRLTTVHGFPVYRLHSESGSDIFKVIRNCDGTLATYWAVTYKDVSWFNLEVISTSGSIQLNIFEGETTSMYGSNNSQEEASRYGLFVEIIRVTVLAVPVSVRKLQQQCLPLDELTYIFYSRGHFRFYILDLERSVVVMNLHEADHLG